jgi:hypothetical protein
MAMLDGFDRYIRHDPCGNLRHTGIIAALNYLFSEPWRAWPMTILRFAMPPPTP